MFIMYVVAVQDDTRPGHWKVVKRCKSDLVLAEKTLAEECQTRNAAILKLTGTGMPEVIQVRGPFSDEDTVVHKHTLKTRIDHR